MNFWNQILKSILAGENIALLCVVSSEGSSPGRQGFKMAVTSKGDLFGSIGGGFMEHKLVELSKAKLTKGKFNPFIKRQIHQTNVGKDRSGMICSGEQTIAFHHLDINSVEQIESITNNEKKVLELSQEGLLLSNEQLNNRISVEIIHEGWSYKEQLDFKNKVYIIGGGHVGLALSQTMKHLGFHVTILDDREGLNTMSTNSYADKKQIVSYNQIADYIPEGDDVYVVLASFGFKPDEVCMRQLIGRDYKYFGVMGSKAKMKQLISNLLLDGFSQKDIKKVHTPIGIPISSKTPEEIAISIAAEIIKIKNS